MMTCIKVSKMNVIQCFSVDACDSGAVLCSDAEIKRKQQQAVERRRLRMLANQNLRAPVWFTVTVEMQNENRLCLHHNYNYSHYKQQICAVLWIIMGEI